MVGTPAVELPNRRGLGSDGLGACAAGTAFLDDGVVEHALAFYLMRLGCCQRPLLAGLSRWWRGEFSPEAFVESEHVNDLGSGQRSVRELARPEVQGSMLLDKTIDF